MTKSRAAMNTNHRGFVGFEIAKDAIPGLKGFASGGVDERCEAIV